MVIQRIGVLSLGKIFAAMHCMFGLVLGAVFSLMSFLGMFAQAATAQVDEQLFALFFGVGAIIILPLAYGIGGFLAGMISAFFYNLVARVAGGIELEVR